MVGRTPESVKLILREVRIGGTLLQLIEYPNNPENHFEVCMETHNATTCEFYGIGQRAVAYNHYEELLAKLATEDL